MAFLSPLATPVNGLDRLYCVSDRVGPFPDCSNDPANVELIQILLRSAIMQAHPPGTNGIQHPTPNGRFDAITGFWIYRFQDGIKRRGAWVVVDGVISPAIALSYGQHDYTIVWLNSQYLGNGQQAFQELAQNQQLSERLRRDLATPRTWALR